MTIFTAFCNKVASKYHQWHYQRAVERVNVTPPLQPGHLPFAVLSMVQKRDVLPYLVALKSFALHANPQRVVVVCDPSIDAADEAVFRQHVPHIELRRAEEFQDPRIPKGGTWERLAAIAQYNTSTYVVQLDADTVALGPLPEVVEAIQRGCGFVIGEDPNQQLLTTTQAAELARGWPDRHIQAVAEKTMAKAGLDLPMYVRGCSGFTGFPVSTDMQDRLYAFAQKMRAATGDRWSEWGTEQVTSNYLVANARGTSVLPFPAYSTPNNGPDPRIRFFHFIGYIRYRSSHYANTTQFVIKRMC